MVALADLDVAKKDAVTDLEGVQAVAQRDHRSVVEAHGKNVMVVDL